LKKSKTIKIEKTPSVTKNKPKIPKIVVKAIGFMNQLKSRRSPEDTMLIHMQLKTGFHTQFIAIVNNQSFLYKKKVYIVDDQFRYYDMSQGLYALDYHEDIAIPIERNIDANKIKRVVKKFGDDTGQKNIENRLDPKSISNFITGEVIQRVMQGLDAIKRLNFMLIVMILNFLFTFFMFLIILQQSGILKNFGL